MCTKMLNEALSITAAALAITENGQQWRTGYTRPVPQHDIFLCASQNMFPTEVAAKENSVSHIRRDVKFNRNRKIYKRKKTRKERIQEKKS